ncbi:MAG: hypothetical protein RR553_09020 [Akkermansia sp.]
MKFSPYFYLFRKVCIAMLFLAFVWRGSSQSQLPSSLPKEFPSAPIAHIADSLVASDGSIWIVGEGGIYKLGRENSYSGSWFDAHYYANYPETENFYAIAEDLQGRIWVGSDNKGVSVFNGEKWQNYTREDTLPGERVFDIAVSPVSGDVAVATSGGVALYSPKKDSWKDLTRRDGLVSDQVASLCFDEEGKLWLAYACGGVSSSSLQKGYAKWDTTQAPWYWDAKQYVRQPFTPKGRGLPSNLCNAILTGKKGEVWTGTTCGLAYKAKGQNWQFVRGSDFNQKNKGVYQSATRMNSSASSKELLPEDYVSALAKSDDGLWVGMRGKGICLWSAEKGVQESLKLPKEKQGKEITSLLVFPNGAVGATSYGGGIFLARKGDGVWLNPVGDRVNPSFPSYPKPVSPEQIMERITGKGISSSNAAPALFDKEDWSTRGNWCGRYGNVYAVLCAANAPYESCIYTSMLAFGKKKRLNQFVSMLELKYNVTGFMGMHRTPDDALRSWVHWVSANSNENVLYCPTDAVRTEAEWDDHGEEYPQSFDGPDVWVRVVVPEGLHRLDLYFYNPNGREGKMGMRDYLVEVRQGENAFDNFEGADISKKAQYKEMEKQIAGLCGLPVQARTRVNTFAGSGVYKSFLLQKEGTYWVRVCRNNSFNTILNGVFISKIVPAGTMNEKLWTNVLPMDFCKKAPLPPDFNREQMGQSDQEFLKSWNELISRGFSTGAEASSCRDALLYEYRQSANNSEWSNLLKWELNLWTDNDRRKFDEIMAASWDTKQETMPDYRSREFMPSGPGTIPFSVVEVRKMDQLGIDWKQYRESSGSKPKLSVKEMKDFLSKKDN